MPHVLRLLCRPPPPPPTIPSPELSKPDGGGLDAVSNSDEVISMPHVLRLLWNEYYLPVYSYVCVHVRGMCMCACMYVCVHVYVCSEYI